MLLTAAQPACRAWSTPLTVCVCAVVAVVLQDRHHGDGCDHGGGTQAQAGSSIVQQQQQQKQRDGSSTREARSSRLKQQEQGLDT